MLYDEFGGFVDQSFVLRNERLPDNKKKAILYIVLLVVPPRFQQNDFIFEFS